ncbi:type II secretion system protein F [Sulfurifustis variabilis]|uniref:Type II secretion system protein F n=1 Tax=Sulfurifustis variabilis TaxID=1675686 RepID=A0A1B4V1C0_9GAMM|nr:type II secretion system F family protein [Sulfurifustis variabilis]BAU47288.1 type II secretion system protein F [Sulfurifustis variabilis]
MAVAAKKPQFDAYSWEGVDKQGKKVRGEMEAASVAFVNATLRRQGINPVKVAKRRKSLGSLKKKKIKPKDIAIFTRQLATMLQAGIPIAQSFEIVGKGHENPSMQELILGIKNDIESGTNLTAALSKHPLYFDALYCNLVAAGEQAGILDNILDKVATYKEKIEAIKGKIKSALFYPTAVVVVAFIITAILLMFVIPQFEDLFKGFGADLPALTQFVIGLSRAFRDSWYLIFGTIIGTIVTVGYTYRRSPKMQHAVDRLTLKAPIVGEIIKKATIARFSRTLATMFAAGVPLVEALESVAGAAGNRIYYEGTQAIRADVSTGMQLQAAMNATGLFPNMVVQMVAIGEESGELDTMLGKVADFYEREVDDAVAALSSLLEPIIMAFLGVVIGGLVVAMYLPIFKMGSVV